MEFNQDVADQVYTVISKLDDEDARIFALFFTDELWHADLAGNQRLVEQVRKSIDDDVNASVAKALLKHLDSGGDPEEAVAIAASVAVAKAESDWWRFQERDRRGRFGRMTRSEYKARVKEIGAQAEANKQGMRAALLEERRSNPTFNNAHQYFRNVDAYRATSRTGHRAVREAREFQDRYNAGQDTESGTSATFNRLQAGGRTVQQIGAATGNPKLAVAGAAANYAGQFGPEAEKVVGPSLRKTAYRYRGTERAPDPVLNRLVGEQSEELLRAEGKSAQPLVRIKTDAQGNQVQRKDKDGNPVFRQAAKTRNPTAPAYSNKGGRQNGVVYVPAWETETVTPSAKASLAPAEKVHVSEVAAINYLMGGYKTENGKAGSHIPSARLAELHRQSGRVTPSEGILIDAQGNVATQAVGFGEDHYLPFNLKNLKSLQGGSYVRTRESGGLTTEDIYTGLMSGARSMTVVSNSGVFTIDFDDTLRGGRRYNDKARQMVDRYASTLDAVQSKQVANPTKQLQPQDKARIRIATEEKIESDPILRYAPAEQKESMIQAAIDQEATRPSLSGKELAEIDRKARSMTDNEREYKVHRRILYDDAMEKLQTRNYQLDGEGYAVAMDALREQFPYYIGDVNAQFKTADTELRFNRSTDQGYVKPRFTRPSGARAGYFDTTITGEGKRGADQTGYQNWPVRGRGRAVAVDSEAAPATPERPRGETVEQVQAKLADQQKVAAEKARVDEDILRDANGWAQIDRSDTEGGGAGIDASYETLRQWSAMDADAKRAMLSDPVARAKLLKEMDAADKEYAGQVTVPKNRHTSMTRSGSQPVSRAALDAPVAPDNPYAYTADDLRQAMSDEATTRLAQQTEPELRNLSTQIRQQRDQLRQVNPQQADQVHQMLGRVELARALKAQHPPEVPADLYDDLAQRTGETRKLTPNQVSSSNEKKTESLHRLLDKMFGSYHNGETDKEQLIQDVTDTLDDDELAGHLSYDEKQRLVDQTMNLKRHGSSRS
jgi:hypothetical protein